MADTLKASVITDHAFAPRLKNLWVLAPGRFDRTPEEIKRDTVQYPPNPALCWRCGLAEAAHRETTIERNP